MMEKVNKKECPKCKNIDLLEFKVEKGDAIISSNLQEYPRPSEIIYHCKCKKCDTHFEYYPTKKSGKTNDLDKIESGLNCLTNNDAYLLKNNLSERSITHKLAEYYQVLFRDWDVDCEYNKNLGQAKEIKIDSKTFLSQMAKNLKRKYPDRINVSDTEELTQIDIEELKKQLEEPEIEYVEELDLCLFLLKTTNNKIVKKTIYPDIIIHKRGTKNNRIVIEAKKSINNNKIARFYDYLKLSTLVSDPAYKYKKGIFIELPVESEYAPPISFSWDQKILNIYKYQRKREK